MSETLIMIAKIKELVKRYDRGLFLALCLLITAGIGYNAGRIWAAYYPVSQAGILNVSNGSKLASGGPKGAIQSLAAPTPADSRVVASKASGSKLYHHPWCSGAKRIKPANQLWFPSVSAAQAAGYTLAANCQ